MKIIIFFPVRNLQAVKHYLVIKAQKLVPTIVAVSDD